MVQAYFVSDVHIGSLEDERAQLFLQFLRTLRGGENVTHLFWVGDIFDLWIADHDYFVHNYAPIIREVQRLHTEGVELHYFEGNHDLYLKRFWENELGFQVHPQVEYFELGGWVVRVEHGDQVDPDDKGYLFLRWLLRTPLMKWVAHNLPEKVIVALGQRASAKSRDYTTNTKSIARDEVIEKLHRHAEMKVQVRPFDLLINGHVHVCDDYAFEYKGRPVRAVNLGTWLDQPAVFLLTPDRQEFVDVTN